VVLAYRVCSRSGTPATPTKLAADERRGAAQLVMKVIEPYPIGERLSRHQVFENRRSGYPKNEDDE
jgi:hypothetical protein